MARVTATLHSHFLQSTSVHSINSEVPAETSNEPCSRGPYRELDEREI